jgi:peroxiredoxin
MTRLAIGDPAPDFTLTDTNGRPISLASYRGQRSVVLVFNRGFS